MESINHFGEAVLLKKRAYEALKQEILLGNFKPGDRLSISELASKMNISYSPVREALNILCSEGLVELPPHKQAIVAPWNEADYEMTGHLRMMIEPYAAEQSTNKIPQERIDRMRKQLEKVLESPKDKVAYIHSDMELHELFHIYLGSKLLSDILNMIKTNNLRYRYINENADAAYEEEIISITKEHLDILDAIEARDASLVYERVLKHIEAYQQRSRDVKTKMETGSKVKRNSQ